MFEKETNQQEVDGHTNGKHGQGRERFAYAKVDKEVECGHLQQIVHHMSHGKTCPTARSCVYTEGITHAGPKIKGKAEKISHGHGQIVVDKLQSHPISGVLYGGGRQANDAEAQHFA